MKIKRLSKDVSKRAESEAAKTSKQMKFLFSLNNRTTARGPYHKAARYTGTLKNEKVFVSSAIHVHNKPNKPVTNKRYITRDAIQAYKREHEDNIINSRDVSAWEQDRFHYTLIISPQYDNELMLDNFTREFMQEMSRDLETNLEWTAAVHRNTDNPHVHVMVRGIDDNGQDLEIRTQYLHRVLPQIASEIATARLAYDRSHDVMKHTMEHKHVHKPVYSQITRRRR